MGCSILIAVERFRQLGGYADWIERLLALKGLANVKPLGHVTNLHGAWDRATFGVFPSRYEGMPLAMVEGMTLGRAVIATDVAGHWEWITDGKNGFLAAAPSFASVDQALEAAWRNRGQSAGLGLKARETATSLLQPEPRLLFADLVEKLFMKSRQ